MSEDEKKNIADNLPSDMTAMLEAMLTMHTLYQNLRAGGFTEREACRVVAYGLFGGMRDET